MEYFNSNEQDPINAVWSYEFSGALQEIFWVEDQRTYHLYEYPPYGGNGDFVCAGELEELITYAKESLT